MSKRPERLENEARFPKRRRPMGNDDNICHLCNVFNTSDKPYQTFNLFVLCPDCYQTEARNAKVESMLVEEKKKWRPDLLDSERQLATMFFTFKFENEVPKLKKRHTSEASEDHEYEEEQDEPDHEEEEEETESGYVPDHEDNPFDSLFNEWLHEEGDAGKVSAPQMREALASVLKAYVYRECEK